MDIFPAIDLRDGKVVRLLRGDYDQMTVYGDDPVKTASAFMEKGARHLHIVDLDGAKDGRLTNFNVIKDIVENVDMFTEVGGGIRDEERVKRYLNIGVDRVILGTAAVRDPEFLTRIVGRYGDRIAVGVDAADGRVAISGWTDITDTDSMEFCRRLRDIGVKTVIYTDISKDGGLGGTNMEAYAALKEIEGLDIVASGGISFEEEITALKDVVSAAILGKAIYSGRLDLARAVELAR